jgi:hypothetical protein
MRLAMNGERQYFNPSKPWHSHDYRQAIQRVCHGFKDGRWLFTEIDGKQRTVAGAEWYDDRLRLGVLPDVEPQESPDPKRAPEWITVKSEDLGDWLFWR